MGGRGASSKFDYSDIPDIVDILEHGRGEFVAIDLPTAGRTAFGKGLSTLPGESLKRIETHLTAGLDHEQLHVIDAHGFVVAAVDGGEGSVGFTQKVFRNSKGNITTHNHPRSDKKTMGGTFSFADIKMLGKSGAKQTRASAKEGTYVLQARNQQQAQKYYQYVTSPAGHKKLREITKTAIYKLPKRRLKKKTTVFNTQLAALNEFYKQTAPSFGLKYYVLRPKDR